MDDFFKATLFAISGYCGTVLVWVSTWSQALTALAAICSFLISAWYTRRTFKLKELESSGHLKRALFEEIQMRTKSAPPEDRIIVDKYFPS